MNCSIVVAFVIVKSVVLLPVLRFPVIAIVLEPGLIGSLHEA